MIEKKAEIGYVKERVTAMDSSGEFYMTVLNIPQSCLT